MLVKNKSKIKKPITQFRVRLRTRNFTAEDLRDKLYGTFFSKPVVVRLGSLTPIEEITSRSSVIEINKCEAIEISRDKKLMKEAFTDNKVKTADWCNATDTAAIKDLGFPIVGKSRTGQGGTGNTLINNQKELDSWKNGKTLSHYIIESFYNYSREYRLHVTKDGCFLAWRKMRKNDAKERWYFNNDNCVWVGEDNPLFDKPVNWDECIGEAVKALNAVGLNIGAIDIRIQSAKDEDGNKRKKLDFIVLESGSAPALSNIGTEAYYKEIIKLIKNKL